MEELSYFSHEALARFVAAEGKTVEKVVCHLWQNRMDKNAPVEIIDNVEFHLGGGHRLTISCNEEGNGLDVIDFDLGTASAGLKEEFGDAIRLLPVDASGTTMWKDVVGTRLKAVKITKEDDNYLADAIMMDFGTEKREIRMGPADGLVIDYFEP
jgi:hypothetical protein